MGLFFSSSSLGGGVNGNLFYFGLAPIAGYKIAPSFSVGPRIDLRYSTGRYREFGSGPVLKFNAFDYGVGLFTRYKFARIFFLHGEYGFINEAIPEAIQDDKITTFRETSDQLLFGLGYTSGGKISSDLYILYDFLADENTVELPIVYRFGFSYNF